jgi:hypothetical protein
MDCKDSFYPHYPKYFVEKIVRDQGKATDWRQSSLQTTISNVFGTAMIAQKHHTPRYFIIHSDLSIESTM